MRKNTLLRAGTTCALLALVIPRLHAAPAEIVLSAVDASHLHGHWTRVADSDTADGVRLATPDEGWANTAGAVGSPANYVEYTFAAAADTPYRVWVRLRADGDSKYNDSVFLQFSDAIDGTGAPLYRIGTTDALLVNLLSCTGCGSGWGWKDGAYWLSQPSTIRFATSGPQTLRLQTREDGVQVDEIVLSPGAFLTTAPGAASGDQTPVAHPPRILSTPSGGTPWPVPGLIEAEDFDEGPNGVAYYDATPANEGATGRDTGVDLEPASDGTLDVGWIRPGEWLAYTVDVAATGWYDLEAIVSSPGRGGDFHVDADGVNLTGLLTIPDTGGWQNWTSVYRQVHLEAGRQTLRVVFDRFGDREVGNLSALRITRHVPTPYGGVAAPVPGDVRPEAFDLGPEGVSYHDTTAGNSGGQFRQTRVDIQNSRPYGLDIGWIADGEWLEYSVDAATAGEYVVEFAVASPVADGRLHLEANGVASAVTAVPQTGDWFAWTTITVPVTLSEGVQIVRVAVDVGGFNIGAMRFSAPAPAAVEPPPVAPEAQLPEADPPVQGAPAPATAYVPAGADLQAAIDAAAPGDTLLLEAGATFVGNFVLPVKAGEAYVTIRSAAPDALLPGAGTRITPAAVPLLAKLRSPNSSPALATAPRAHHYRLLFLELQANAAGAGTILALGSGGADQDTLDVVPHDLVVDRVYIHGDPVTGQKRGIGLNSASTTVLNSHVSEIKAVGQDSQAIGGWNGPGPYLISNNYLEAAGENVMFGGADPAIPQLVPSDITFTRNHLAKPLAWRSEAWSVKNLFELKSAQRVVVDGNLLENHWQAAQAGYAVLLKSVNQGGTAPWSVVRDVTFTNNVVRHVSSAINILGRDPAYPAIEASNIIVRNNLFEDVSGARYGGVGRFLLINGGRDITVDHNTVLNDGSTTIFADANPVTGFTLTNNVMPDNAYGIKGSGTAVGTGTITAYFPNGLVVGNLFAGARASAYPTGNDFPASLDAVGFVAPASGDYGLAPASLYAGAADDGGNPGCDIGALRAALGALWPW
ncbi:MAG: carbohydrate-binding protein [Vicinamibacterales bacterium]